MVIMAGPVFWLEKVGDLKFVSAIIRLVLSLAVGLLPGPRGTYGSLLVAAAGAGWLWLGGGPLIGWGYWILLLCVCGLVLWLGQLALERQVFGPKGDPCQIVLDEAAGMLLAMHNIQSLGWELPAAFVLFRFFDIVKPFPINRLERLPGAWGVLCDDLGAGLYSLLCLMALQHFLA